ncbi:MAG: helix-turn-helix domain-containing protein [Deltaproteobacteria bacterium]|jgi:AraC family transcriptional regulator of adaptative response / DNA-3-methyladenine glycosylase II|nr:helix-turn-helix domain-containing protein [Deltaproteobacteria bacterium]
MAKNGADHGGLDGPSCYAALRARDSRFDGRFFVGVSSTGIYCRPVCRVRLPKEENCAFYASAAAAEAAGYRPCLRCRPELAPGLSQMEALARTARKARLLLEEEWLSGRSLSELAEKLGITDRHLRRSFAAEYGVSPVQFLQTRRLLLAKSLLTDTTLPVTEVAMATGFGSIRRFNDSFRQQYRLSPSGLRKLKEDAPSSGRAAGNGPGNEPGSALILNLGYRPPYAWERLLRFLDAQAVPGVEAVAGGVYLRAVALEGGGKLRRGWIKVENRPEKHALALTLPPSLLPALPKLLARVRALFDLNSSPADIYEQLRDMDRLMPGLNAPGTRLPGSFAVFETAVAALLNRWNGGNGQARLMGRLAGQFGIPVETPWPALRRVFPEARALRDLEATDELTANVIGLAKALRDGNIDLTPGADPAAALEKLLDQQVFGLSPWSAQFLVMRALGWTDAFPGLLPACLAENLAENPAGNPPANSPMNSPTNSVDAFPRPPTEAVRRLQSELAGEAFRERAQAWRPWRAYASMNLWHFFTSEKTLSQQSETATSNHKQEVKP